LVISLPATCPKSLFHSSTSAKGPFRYFYWPA